MRQEFDISFKTILKIILSFLLFYFLYRVREILLWILYAIVISILFEKPIDFLSKKIPRTLGVIIVYFSLFSFLILLIYFAAKPLFFEIQNFISFLPFYFEKVSPYLKTLGIVTYESFQDLTKSLENWLKKSSKSIVLAISAIFGSLFATFSIISLAMFLSLEKDGINNLLSQFFRGKREFFLAIWKEAKEKISLWFGFRILMCFYVAVATFICLLVLKINYPFSLSFLAGILDFIPILGPVAAGILLFIFGTLDSFLKGIFIVILFVLIQQIEANVLGPFFGQKVVGFPPFLVLVSLLIGGKLLGLGGAILAIPLAGIFFKILQEVFKE